MAKYCPLGELRLCNSDCAWQIDGECAIVRLAVSSYDKEMKQRFIAKYVPNWAYGTMREGFQYVDTDSVKENKNENT